MSFDQEFCDNLEYSISKAFLDSGDIQLKYYWCDGVKLPLEDQLDKATVTRYQKITTEAWIGTDGQTLFGMTIKLGPYALNN